MFKFIITALAILVGAFSFAPVASAAPYLSMSKAKRVALKDAKEIANYEETWLGSCSRKSPSRVACVAYTYSDGIECEFHIGVKMSYGKAIFYNPPGETDCYEA